jgi:hypothetical protein
MRYLMFRKLNKIYNICLNQDTLLNTQSLRYELAMRPRSASVAKWTKWMNDSGCEEQETHTCPWNTSAVQTFPGGWIGRRGPLSGTWRTKCISPPPPQPWTLDELRARIVTAVAIVTTTQMRRCLRYPRTPHRTFLKLESSVGKLYNTMDFVSYLEFCSCWRYDCSKVSSNLKTPCIALQQGDGVSSGVRSVWFSRQECGVCSNIKRALCVCVLRKKKTVLHRR